MDIWEEEKMEISILKEGLEYLEKAMDVLIASSETTDEQRKFLDYLINDLEDKKMNLEVKVGI